MERVWLRYGWRLSQMYPLLRPISSLSPGTVLPERTSLTRNLLCPLCQRAQASMFHTSSSDLGANHALKSKKKLFKKSKFSKALSKQIEKEAMPMLVVWPQMTVQELTDLIGKDLTPAFNIMNKSKLYSKPDTVIDDFTLITSVLKFFGFRWKQGLPPSSQTEAVDLDVYPRPPAEASVLKKRPPVVTIMGHVDHGKTTLLDALRKTNVVAQEFGGITQHIGAFSVPLPTGDVITFLDTPGHAAFSAMRARGAYCTDIVVLVVAADDGVMAQTVESIDHARHAGVPVIVAINKCDKPNANVDYAKQSLSEHGVYLEEHGGDIQAIEISALKGTNLDHLLDAIIAQAEILEVKADPTGLVEGRVIESHKHPGRGRVATVLVQRGTLKKGQVLVAGLTQARVRNIIDDKGKMVTEATPGTPVEVTGWKDLPSAGEQVLQVESERRANEVTTWRQKLMQDERLERDSEIIRKKREEHHEAYRAQREEMLNTPYYLLGKIWAKKQQEQLRAQEEEEEVAQLAIVVKADVDGSLEAITNVVSTYDSDQCQLHIVTSGVGDVSENDVEMAKTFNGVIFAFNVKSTPKAADLARENKILVRHHNVIYRMFDDLKEQLTARLPPVTVEEVIGEANVLQLFHISEGKKKLTVTGCRCTKGFLSRKKHFKLMRDNEVLHEGSIISLKHFKNEVDMVKTDVECGLMFSDQGVVPQPGDTVICCDLKDTPQVLHWELEF